MCNGASRRPIIGELSRNSQRGPLTPYVLTPGWPLSAVCIETVHFCTPNLLAYLFYAHYEAIELPLPDIIHVDVKNRVLEFRRSENMTKRTVLIGAHYKHVRIQDVQRSREVPASRYLDHQSALKFGHILDYHGLHYIMEQIEILSMENMRNKGLPIRNQSRCKKIIGRMMYSTLLAWFTNIPPNPTMGHYSVL